MVIGVEYVREQCKANDISVFSLEKECGFSNGYLNPKKIVKVPYERALLIAQFFQKRNIHVDINRILGVDVMTAPAINELKSRIKMLCSKNGVSMNKLEEELGFGKGYISKLGSGNPNTSKLQKIANRFSVTLDYLMTGEGTSKSTALSEEEQRIWEIAKRIYERGADPDAVEAILDAVDKIQK